jgi:EAL domain-containing protein (putative c-di-GMP-specific phosphodiesterase class I)
VEEEPMSDAFTPSPMIVSPSFGHRKVAPRACVADKPHLQEFFCDALQDIGFVACKYDPNGNVAALLAEYRPDVVVLGLSAGGVNAAQLLEALAAYAFDGRVLVVGAPASPMSEALQGFGVELGLDMLPMLATPFSHETLRARLADTLPDEAPPQPVIDIAEALHSNWLELWYQPKIEIRSFSLCGAEALIRLRHPTWGIVQPASFLPDESDADFRGLSEFVIGRAIEDWHYFLGEYGPVELAINLPLSFLKHPHSVEQLGARMPAHPAFEGAIVEVNGTDLVQSTAVARSIAKRLRLYNLAMSIDDLGAEWPALLDGADDFPFAEIKVDRSLVAGCAEDRLKQSVCRRILEFADRVGSRTVAEGVETRADFVTVRELGFDLVQGFFLSKPLEARKFARRVLREPLTLPK